MPTHSRQWVLPIDFEIIWFSPISKLNIALTPQVTRLAIIVNTSHSTILLNLIGSGSNNTTLIVFLLLLTVIIISSK